MRNRAAIVGLWLAAATSPVLAEDSEHPVVVELFLSQACRASPPAAEHFVDLQKRADLVVLTWHVDYWDLLSTRKSGRWKDAFATPEAAVRQRIYNRKVRDKGVVFTPQAIVNGAGSAVGSKRNELAELIELAPRVHQRAEIDFEQTPAGLSVAIRAAGEPREAFLVRFREFAATKITGGDNAGVEFREPNVVTEFVRLGTVSPRRETFVVAAPAEGMGCAVLLQERGQGAVTAARYCP